MVKKILLTFLIIFSFLSYKNAILAYSPYIPKGMLVKVYAKIPINTKNLEEGSRVYFISPGDVWVQETKMINKGDIFLGYVDYYKMPVQGVNAAMKVKIDAIIQQGTEKNMNGRIIFNSSDTIGGTLTNPSSYNKTIHPRRVYGNYWGGTLQWVPSGKYEFGSHVEITTRDSVFVQFDEDFYM